MSIGAQVFYTLNNLFKYNQAFELEAGGILPEVTLAYQSLGKIKR